jgi:hypothetical protein
LPIHYVRILVAVELKNTPNLEADAKTYTFEGDVVGYYNDPTPPSLRNDKLHKSGFTHTTTQYFYAQVNPRLERVLGSTNMHASSKVFVDGDYRFPAEQTSTPGYIEVRNVTFNATNRPTQGVNVANGTGASGGSGGKRRNVVLKSSPAKSPAKPRYTPGGSSQAGPSRSFSSEAIASTSRRETSSRGVGFTTSGASANDRGSIGDMLSVAGDEDDEASMSFALGEFGDGIEVDVTVPKGRSILDLEPTANPRDLQNKRGHDNTADPETSKRQRKPSAKAKEQEGNMLC